MQIINISTAVFFALVAIGFILGFFRGWKRSLVRTVSILVALLVALFVAPSLASSIVSSNSEGAKLTLFSFTIDFEKIVNSISEGESGFSDLFANGSAANDLALSLMNMVVNIALFIIIFVAIWLVSLLVYWIVLLIVKIKTKNLENVVQRDGKYWTLKIVSALIGLFGSIGICFVVINPVFGVMNICDGFLTNQEVSQNTQTANAVNFNSYMCGNLYYTEDKNIGKIEGYIEKYAKIRAEYDSSAIGKVFNATGLSKAGIAAFNHLTTVKQGGLEIKFTDEFVSIIKVYNLYKDNFVKSKFDITDNSDIDALIKLYDEAIESQVLKNFVVELVPKIGTKWSSGEKFLGISSPINGEWSDVIYDAMEIFKVDNINRISANLKALANAVKVANDNNLISAIKQNQKVEDLLGQNNNLINDEIIVLTSTIELRENISIILNDAFEVLYKQVISEEKEFEDNRLTNEEILNLNQTNGWQNEAQNIQNTVVQIFAVYDVVKVNNNSEALLDKLANIGAAIDSARESKLVSKPFKEFITGFISKKVSFDDNIKTQLLDSITSKWEDSTFKFEAMFKAIQDAAIVAKNLSSGLGDISLEDLSSTVKDIISNENVKDTIANVLESDIIKNVVGDENSDTIGVITDVLETLVTSDKVNADTIDADITAGQEIVNIVNNVKNNDGKLNLGETVEEKQAAADSMVSNLTSSEGVMDLLESSTQSEQGSAITDFTQNVSTDDKLVIEESISKLDDNDPNKETLKKLFGIV